MTRSARAHISQATLEQVLARHSRGGLVCCSDPECSKPITDDQILTIQHHVPRRELTFEVTHDPEKFAALANKLGGDETEITRLCVPDEALDGERRLLLRGLLNAPANLSPMHEACHRKADFGMIYPPEEAARINRKPPEPELTRPANIISDITHMGAAHLASQVLETDLGGLNRLLRRHRDIETIVGAHEQLERELAHFQDEDYVPKAERARRAEMGDPADMISDRLSYLETYLRTKAAKGEHIKG